MEKKNGSDAYPDIAGIFDLDDKMIPDKPIKTEAAPRELKKDEKILTSPDGYKYLPKEQAKQIRKADKKKKRDAAVKKIKTRAIIVLAAVLVLLAAVIGIKLYTEVSGRPSVTLARASAGAIDRYYESPALIMKDASSVKAVFIDNDYDVHYIERNLGAFVRTEDGAEISGTVGQIKEVRSGASEFSSLAGALLEELPLTSFYAVSIDLTDEEDVLKDGQVLTARVITKSSGNAVLVPSTAVSTAGNQEYVWVYHRLKKTLTRQDVAVGIVSDGQTEILKGVSRGDQVVVNVGDIGKELFDGIKVRTE